MGDIESVSLPSGITCRKDCDCINKCYARRLERIRPSVKNSYKHNLEVLQNTPDLYWREVEASVMMSRFFRFHVSGDIPDENYLHRMIWVAEKNPHCQILCFTKKHEIVNAVLDSCGELPTNLHLIMSGWRGLEMHNPHNLPEAHVRYKDGTTTARSDAKPCGGNCTNCALVEEGCWTLKNGEQVVFDEH